MGSRVWSSRAQLSSNSLSQLRSWPCAVLREPGTADGPVPGKLLMMARSCKMKMRIRDLRKDSVS